MNTEEIKAEIAQSKKIKKTAVDINEVHLAKHPSVFLQELIKTGIPVRMAVFHKPVRSVNGEPETEFHAQGAKPSRTATMWATPYFLICEQLPGKGKPPEYLLAYNANVAYARVI
jgi:hypothetical protein